MSRTRHSRAAPAAPRRPTPAAAPPRPPLLQRLPPWGIPAALVGLHLFLALLAFNPTPDTGGDNAAYVSLARSLIERHAYLELWDPAVRAHTQYPPVFPAVLAVAMLLGIKPWVGLKLVVVAFSGAAVAVSYLWMRRVTSPRIALAAGVVLAVAPGVLVQSHWVLSDVPAWLFTALALWASTHLSPPAVDGGETAESVDADVERRAARKWGAVLVAGVVLAVFTRSAGLPLVVAAAVWLVMRRRWGVLAALAAVYLPLEAAWLLRAAATGHAYASYVWAVDPYRPELGTIGPKDVRLRLAMNLFRYCVRYSGTMLVDDPRVGPATAALVVVPGIAGWALRLRRRPSLAEVWVPFYVALLLVWPSTWASERFLLPLIPLVLVYGGEVIRDLATRLGGARAGLVAGVAAVVLLLGAAAPGVARQVITGAQCTGAYREGDPFPCTSDLYHDFFAAAQNARGWLPPGSVVLSRKPTLWYVISGYRSRVYPLSADPDTFFAAAREAGAKYLVFDRIPGISALYLDPMLLKRRDDFCVLRDLSLPNAVVMRIQPGAPRRTGVPPNSFRVCDFPDAAPPGAATR